MQEKYIAIQMGVDGKPWVETDVLEGAADLEDVQLHFERNDALTMVLTEEGAQTLRDMLAEALNPGHVYSH